jgi:hypothetical protein
MPKKPSSVLASTSRHKVYIYVNVVNRHLRTYTAQLNKGFLKKSLGAK